MLFGQRYLPSNKAIFMICGKISSNKQISDLCFTLKCLRNKVGSKNTTPYCSLISGKLPRMDFVTHYFLSS